MRHSVVGLVAVGVAWSLAASAVAADPPAQQLWSGRLADKTTVAPFTQPGGGPNSKTVSDSKSKSGRPPMPSGRGPREPDWLRNMDKNDRSTLTGGWGLQNWSGGTQSQTTAGDRSGQYAPNSYQGLQFQQWNNVSNRQNIPGWNGTTPGFPRQMWSQGYVSPNNYYGTDAQGWGNMSSGRVVPNTVSGGWTMSGW